MFSQDYWEIIVYPNLIKNYYYQVSIGVHVCDDGKINEIEIGKSLGQLLMMQFLLV